MVRCCSACRERQDRYSEMSFHEYPHKNQVLMKAWLKNVRRKNWTPTKNHVLCSKHFTPDSFEGGRRARRKLKPTAVPTIFDFPQHLKKNLPHSQDEMTFEVDNDYNPKSCLTVNVPHQTPGGCEKKDSKVIASLCTSGPTSQEVIKFETGRLLTLEDIRREFPFPRNLMTGFIRNAVIFGKLNDSGDTFLFKVTINSTMETELTVLGRTLDENHPLVPLFPRTIDKEDTLKKTIELFDTWHVCIGNADEVFLKIYHGIQKKSSFISFHTGAIHSEPCTLLTDNSRMRCNGCIKYRGYLRRLSKRLKLGNLHSLNNDGSVSSREQFTNKMKCAQAIKRKVFSGKILSKVENTDTEIISQEVESEGEVESAADWNKSFEYSGSIEWTVS